MYKLLIVDDERAIRDGLSTIIKWHELGFELVGAVENAKMALKIIDEKDIDVLLTDISMPEMSGLELIETLRHREPKLRTVVISGYNKFDYAVEAIKLRVETYILKPLDPNEINETFIKLKADMDRKLEGKKRKVSLQSGYELMRVLYSDIKNIKNVLYSNSEKKHQLVLIYTLFDDKEQSSRFKNILTKYMYRNIDDSYAVITFPTQLNSLLGQIKKFFSDRDSTNYKIVVTTEYCDLLDTIPYYLNAINIFEKTSWGQTSTSIQTSYISENKYLISYMEKLVSIIEKGDYNKIYTIIDNLFDELVQDKQTNLFETGMKLLRNIMLYFRIDKLPSAYFDKLSQNYLSTKEDTFDCYTRAKSEFLKDIEEMLKYLKSNSENMAIMISYQARQLINENYMDKNLSLRNISDQLNISYGYLSAEFSKTFNMNYIDYVTEVRLEKARELLMERKFKVYEIADQVGYTRSRYFTDLFKKRYGALPLNYLKRMNNGLQNIR